MDNRLYHVLDTLASRDDPRLNSDFWAALPAAENHTHPTLVVGTVHDHPASSYRVRTLAEEFDPEILALELPSVALPYYEQQARRKPAAETTCEMSTAIGACPASNVVGIDSLGPAFFGELTRTARAESASVKTISHVLKDVAQIARHAVTRRVNALQAPIQEGTPDHGRLSADTADHATHTDTPADQAHDERAQVARSRSLLGAIKRPKADMLLDRTREKNMARKIESLSHEGPVLAVVGQGHLDEIATHMKATPLS